MEKKRSCLRDATKVSGDLQADGKKKSTPTSGISKELEPHKQKKKTLKWIILSFSVSLASTHPLPLSRARKVLQWSLIFCCFKK